MKQFCSANVINCVCVELLFNGNILTPFLKLLSDSPAILLKEAKRKLYHGRVREKYIL